MRTSKRIPNRASRDIAGHAPLFAALGDETRLALLAKLSRQSPASISQLTTGAAMTRQAITKHLRVMERAGLIRGVRRGREQLFQLERRRLDEARHTLDRIAQQWDDALQRLKSFVEA
jgi:DNA-binding transcriptional ArsR family regulator